MESRRSAILVNHKLERRKSTSFSSFLPTNRASTYSPSSSNSIFSYHLEADFKLIIGFSNASLPVKYIDIPLLSSKQTMADFKPLLHRLDKRISTWNLIFLSYTGRTTPIKSVLLVIYFSD